MLIGNISFLHENVCNLSGTASSGLVLFDASKSPSRRPRLYSGARPGLPPTLSFTRSPPPLLAFAPAPGHLLPPPPAYHPTTLTNPDFSLLALCQQDSPGPSLPERGSGGVGSLLCSSKLPDERRCVPCLLQAPPVLQYPAPCPLPPAGRPPYISAVFAANSGLTVSAGPLLLLGQVARGGTRPWQGCPPPPQNSAAQQSAPGSTFFV